MGKKLITFILMCVLVVSSAVQISAQVSNSSGMRGKELQSNPIPVNEDLNLLQNGKDFITPLSTVVVTGSGVWYGWQKYAEGRLLCIEGYVTAAQKHYTRTTMQKISTGVVHTFAYKEGTGTVNANKYDITPPPSPETFEGRVFYGAA